MTVYCASASLVSGLRELLGDADDDALRVDARILEIADVGPESRPSGP
jgi:hypothetical protein